MATKLAAAKIAAWSGVRTVIAAADRPGVVADALADVPGVGTVVRPRSQVAAGPQAVDRLRHQLVRHRRGRRRRPAGARDGRVARCCPPGWSGAKGRFAAGAAVEVADDDGVVFAKGIVGLGAAALREVAGVRTGDLPDGVPHEVIHRDDLVVLPG